MATDLLWGPTENEKQLWALWEETVMEETVMEETPSRELLQALRRWRRPGPYGPGPHGSRANTFPENKFPSFMLFSLCYNCHGAPHTHSIRVGRSQQRKTPGSVNKVKKENPAVWAARAGAGWEGRRSEKPGKASLSHTIKEWTSRLRSVASAALLWPSLGKENLTTGCWIYTYSV